MLTLAVSRAAWVMLTFRTSVYAVTLGVILPVEAGVMLTLAVQLEWLWWVKSV